MNYSAKDLKPLTRWDGQPKELLVWNDDWPDTPPMKRRVIGMEIASKPWIAEIYLQDGTDTMSYQHAAEIPNDWTPVYVNVPEVAQKVEPTTEAK